jgi:6-phosphogluconolactonase
MQKARRFGALVGLAVLMVSAVIAAPASATRAQRAVYTMSNSPDGNEILAFERGADGSLTFLGSFSTGGLGTGTGLGNQNGVVLNRDFSRLFVVNAGSDDISSFFISPKGMELKDTEPSNGDRPISLTVHGRLLYVLNDQSGGNITGYRVESDGNLEPIPGSTQEVEGEAPAQIQFSPGGRHLVVTEKGTNTIAVYAVMKGRAQPPVSYPSVGPTPFGFAFDNSNHLIVSEAFGGAPNAAAVSSYEFNAGSPSVISGSVHDNQTAACWIVVTRNGKYAYTTNTGSASISGYLVGAEGQLELLDSDGVTATTGAVPIDLALTPTNRFLYSLDSGAHQISAFAVNADGSLTPLGASGGLPDGANGLAAT